MTTTVPTPAPLPAPKDDDASFTFTLEAGEGYQQIADFQLDHVAPLVIDEPPPLGQGAGPNPSRILAAALGSCLGASLLFCLRKARIDVRGLHTTIEGHHGRNEQGRLRLRRVSVRLEPVIPVADHGRIARCVEIFEDFCVVTASVRPAIDVQVQVIPVSP